MSQPNYSSAVGYIGEQFFTVSFDIDLDAGNPPPLNSFAAQINGTDVTISAVAVDSAAKTVTLTFASSTLLPGDIIDFVYADPTPGNDANAIQGTDGTDSASFSHSIVIAITRPGPSAPPTPTLDSASDSGTLGDFLTNDNTPTINGTADANATVKLYDTDGSTLLGTTTADGKGVWSIDSSQLGDGSHTLKVTQTDGSNNTSPLSNGLALTIDTVASAPTSLAVSAGSDSGTLGDGISNVGTPVITGKGEANASVTLYDTDGTTKLGTSTADGKGNWSITSSTLAGGAHTLTAKQTDVAGNVSAASSNFSYTLDTVGPTGMALSTNSVQQASATNGATVATLSSTDLTSVTYGFAVGNGVIDADNGKFSISGTSLKAAQNLSAGTYHVYLSATDAAGNDAFQIFTISVTNAPGVSSIVRAGSASSTVQTTATSVDYTVTFDQSVTGVDASDFTVTAGGSAAGSVSSVTGSGTTYTVTVDTISGDGTLRLDLNSSGTGIKNGGSVDISGGYTSGETYTLDHTAPTAPSTPAMTAGTDTGSSSSDAITKNITPVFTGTGEANTSVTLYDTDGSTVLGTTAADGSGKWSITSTKLGDGPHSVTVKQTDAAGNVSSASSSLAVLIDTTSPSAPATPVLSAGSDSGVSGDFLTNVSIPVITGTAEANATIKLYDTDGSTLLGTTTADGKGNWSITSSTLADGSHSLTVKQTDLAGNVSSASSALTLDIDTSTPSVPGTLSLAAKSDSGTLSDGITNVTAPVIVGTGTVGDTVSLYDTDGTTVLGTAVVDGSGNWSVTSSTLSDGVHTFTVKQTNAAGTTSSASKALALTIDATAPTAPSLPVLSAGSDSGTLGDNQTKFTTPVLTGTGEANATIKLYDTDGTTLLGTTTADGSGKWSITSSTLSDGVHTVTVKQTDAAGNTSVASSGLALTIDSTAPSAPATPALSAGSDSGTLGDNKTNATTPVITGTGEANASIKLYDTDGTTLLGTTTADGSGKWSITSSTLSEGAHTVTVKQTDVAGNVSVASSGLALTIDATAPSAPGVPVLSSASDTDTLGDNKTYVTQPIFTGTGEASATITLYDTNGTTVLGTTTADGSGKWSITSSELGQGDHALTVKQTDVAGNTSVASSGLALTIEAPPGNTIDGVMVEQRPTVLPDGSTGTQVTIPVITSGRVDDTGSTGLADIPLVTKDTSTILSAHVPLGFGLTASGGASQPAGNSLEHLISAIIAATPNNAPSDQTHLTGNGQSFLNLLPSTVPLLVQTVVPTTGSTAPNQALTLTGSSSASQHTALVIDASQLPSGSSINLQQVDFAAVVGSVSVTGSTSGQILTGDAANQHFTIAASGASQVFSGGGNDTLELGVSLTPVSATMVAAQVTTTVLHGGQGSDTVVFSGSRTDYTIESHDGYVMVTSSALPDQQTLVINAESLKFSDATVAVETRSVLDTIAGLYQSVLGRQADYLGMDYWGAEEQNGVSLGKMVLDLINSAEAQGKHAMVFNGNAAHDIELLYQGIFNRSSDNSGLAYWVDAMAHGTTLEQVAQNFATAQEMEVHKVGVQNWDFLV